MVRFGCFSIVIMVLLGSTYENFQSLTKRLQKAANLVERQQSSLQTGYYVPHGIYLVREVKSGYVIEHSDLRAAPIPYQDFDPTARYINLKERAAGRKATRNLSPSEALKSQDVKDI